MILGALKKPYGSPLKCREKVVQVGYASLWAIVGYCAKEIVRP